MIEQNVPVLLVGLGGIGGSIVNKVMEKIPKEQRDHVGAVAIDTDLGDLNKLEEVQKIWMGNDGIVKNLLVRYPEYLEWFPANKFINTRGLGEGAGQIRAIARLVMAASVRSDYNPLILLDKEVRRILEHSGEKSISRFNVFITGSITGGTGAGSFLQVAYYIRNLMERTMSASQVQIRGMFVSSDITESVNPSEINRKAVKINAYACMKELNALYLTQASDTSDSEQLELDFYSNGDWLEEFELEAEKILKRGTDIPGKNLEGKAFRDKVMGLIDEGSNIPYNSFYLVEGTDNKGTTGNNSLETIKNQVARMIHTLLFTPVGEKAASSENNGTLLDIYCQGMNRYSAAGLCSLVYPYEQIKEYISLRFCKKIINDEWLLLDQECEQEKKDAMSKQKSDPSVRIPDIMDTYIRKFEDETSGNEGTRLGGLKDEAYVVNEDSIEEPVCKMDGFIDLIDERIREVLKEKSVTDQEKACQVSLPNMKEFETAVTEVRRKTEAAEQYALSMINLVKKRQYQVANEVFPESFESMEMHKRSPLSVYSYIGKAHPVAARYLCYKMIQELDSRLAGLGTGISKSALEGFSRKDYDPKKDDIQTAEDVIISAQDEKLLFLIPTGKKTLKDVADRFQSALKLQVSLTKRYGETQLQISTYRALRRRFAQLAKNYEVFFENVKNRIDGNNEKIANLENSFVFKPYGTRIVYGSPDAFKQSFAEFSSRAVFELPEAAKEAVFSGLFLQAAILFENEGSSEISPETRKKAIERAKSDIGAIFDTGIMKNMRDYVDIEGDKIVDISIKDAIVKQMKLEGYSEHAMNFDQMRVEYERNLINLAMSEAAPMVAVLNDENTSENVYIALNPEAGEMVGGKFDLAMTTTQLAVQSQATDMQIPSVLANEGFSKYELVCLKVKHKYKVEQLAKYRPKSEYANLYFERISGLGLDPIDIGEDVYKTVVTPHLHRFWHEDGYLPALTETERIQMKRRILKAFIYSMGMDVFIKEKIEGVSGGKKWKYVNIKEYRIPVEEKGQIIRAGYVDLYKALRNNRSLVNNILERAKYEHEAERSSMGILEAEDMVNQLTLLKDLIQEQPEPGDSNILDILEDMIRKERMKENSWNDLFTGLQLALTEYLHDIFKDNYVHADEIYKKAVARMYEASRVGKKEAAAKAAGTKVSYDEIEKKIQQHVKQLKAVSITY